MIAEGKPVAYAPLPQNYVVLPLYRPPERPRRLRRILLWSAAAVLLSASVFLLWPSDPELKLVRLRLNRVRVISSPKLALDLSLSLTLKVRNRDFFSLDYQSLSVSIGYRGRALGFVNSDGGRIRARGSSYVDATLDLDGLEIVHDVFYLIEDLAKGSIPFDADTEVRGDLGVFFFKIPLQARVSCEVYVNVKNQTVMHQDCRPK
ncbi:uncharacterized protein LOC131157076 isoform X2 [Malania oleifera]|nr:uncharacterized protein LOC131157076 isoform X2 [Malania oleifera]